jgi:hypothetical protein
MYLFHTIVVCFKEYRNVCFKELFSYSNSQIIGCMICHSYRAHIASTHFIYERV